MKKNITFTYMNTYSTLKRHLLQAAALLLAILPAQAQTAAADYDPVDYVNPFIGTTNYGTTHPAARYARRA